MVSLIAIYIQMFWTYKRFNLVAWSRSQLQKTQPQYLILSLGRLKRAFRAAGYCHFWSGNPQKSLIMGDAEGDFTGEGSPPAAISQTGTVANNSMDQSHVTIMNNDGGHQFYVSFHYHHHGQHPEGLNCVFCSSCVITVVHVLRTASLLPQGKVSYTWLQVIPWSGCERKHINPYLYFLFGIHTPTSC